MPRSIKIDLENVATKDALHDRLARGLEFPDYYGRNWDAFWDCLTDLPNQDFSEITFTDWDRFSRKLTIDAGLLLRCLNKWSRDFASDDSPKLYLVTRSRRIEIPDTIDQPLFTGLVPKEILFSDDYLHRGVIALRHDGNFEVRIEGWEYHDDPVSYPSCYSYWSEQGKPSLTDSLELGRRIAMEHACKNKG